MLEGTQLVERATQLAEMVVPVHGTARKLVVVAKRYYAGLITREELIDAVDALGNPGRGAAFWAIEAATTFVELVCGGIVERHQPGWFLNMLENNVAATMAELGR